MFCPKCGKEIPDNSTYCLNCGTNLKEAVHPSALSSQQAPPSGQKFQFGPGGGTRTLFWIGVLFAALGFLLFLAGVLAGGYCANSTLTGCYFTARDTNTFTALEVFGGSMFGLGVLMVVVGSLKKV